MVEEKMRAKLKMRRKSLEEEKMKAKLKMRRKTLVIALMVLFIVSTIPVGAQMIPTIDGVISSGEWGEVDFTKIGYEGYKGYKVYVLNDLDYLYVAFVDQPGADYNAAQRARALICVYPGDDYAGECWAYRTWGPDLTHYTTDGEQDLPTTSVVEARMNVMEWKIPLDEFSAKPGDTIAFDLYSYIGFSDIETTWIYEVYYTLWAPTTVDLTANVVAPPVSPVADADGPYYCDRYETIWLDGSGSHDPDGTIVSYEWDFGDGTTGTGVKPSHTYSKTGTFNIKLTVTDNDDLTDSNYTTVKVSKKPSPPPMRPPNKKPKADAGPNMKISVGSTLYFIGSESYDKDGTIVKYSWDFGDGATAKGVEADHKYTEPGHYTVTLVVRDNRGAEDSDKCHVKVWKPSKEVSNRFGELVHGKKKGHIVNASEVANTTVTLNTTKPVTVTVLVYDDNPHPEDPIPAKALPIYVDVEVSNSTAVEWPIYVEMFYTDEEVEGLNESSLGIYYWFNGTWQRCSNTGVDTENNVVWAYMTAEEAGGSPILMGGISRLKPAEFEVSDLAITPLEVEPGEEVEISLLVKNIGEQQGSHILSVLIENGQIFSWTSVIDLDGGTNETVRYRFMPEAEGNYTVEFNSLTTTFEVKTIPLKPAEFEVSDLTIEPEEVVLRDKVTISVLVTNIGEELGDYYITWDIESLPTTSEVVTLEGGQSKTARKEVSIGVEGTYAVDVNGLMGGFTVITPPTPAEFVLGNFTYISEIQEGEPFELSIDVLNVGETAGEVLITIKIDGEVAHVLESYLEPGGGASETWTTFYVYEVGTHTIELDGFEDAFDVTAKPVPFWKRPEFIVFAIFIAIIIAGAAYIYFKKVDLSGWR